MDEAVVLVEGLKKFGFECSDEVVGKFQAYADLLIKWNRVYNLTAITKREEVLTHHLLDCVAMIPHIKTLRPNALRVLDVGSGGGLPAVPLAILRPDLQVRAVDSVGKKVAFINNAAIELGLKNLRGTHSRVEQISGQKFDVITSRAFSSLDLFVDLTKAILANGGCWFAMKGVEPTSEVESLPDFVEVVDTIRLDVPGLKEERHLIVMERSTQ